MRIIVAKPHRALLPRLRPLDVGVIGSASVIIVQFVGGGNLPVNVFCCNIQIGLALPTRLATVRRVESAAMIAAKNHACALS